MGNAPYLAATSDALDVKARDLGLAFAPGAYVHLLPNIAGFVGADHVTTFLSTGLDLLVTNLYVSSAAMGVLSVAKTVPSAILTLFGTLASVYAPPPTISTVRPRRSRKIGR